MNCKKQLLMPCFLGTLFSLISFAAIAQDSLVISLWPGGAPGFEKRKDEPEEAKDWWVKNINNPSLTFFRAPQSISTGAAVIICPGGGHRALVFNAEGTDAAKFMNTIGINAFVLKYRLFREENTVYTMENAKQDVFRAMRLVRGLSKEYKLDTAKIGVMGFSAGGELAGWLSYHYQENHGIKNDGIDALSARPSFQILIYPGPLVVPDSVSVSAPVTFLLAANNDACCSQPVITLLQMHRKAKVAVEVHLYEQGDHGFNMGKRSLLNSIHSWPQRLADWLNDSGISPCCK
jgi:acetyl esterase/lipase